MFLIIEKLEKDVKNLQRRTCNVQPITVSTYDEIKCQGRYYLDTIDAPYQVGFYDVLEDGTIIYNATGGGGSPTALSTGTVTLITYGITSDGAVDDLILVEANGLKAGVLGAAKWLEIVANTLKIGVTTELKPTDIDTLAELNAIITDAILIDTLDSRLSDARIPLAHVHNAVDVPITDGGGIIAAIEVEGALQENRIAINLNTAKVSNVTHTGEFTGAGLVIAHKTLITNKTLVTALAGDHVLIADGSDLDNLKRVDVSDFLGGAGDDLGNHIATQVLEMGANGIGYDAANPGVFFSANGNVALGTSATSAHVNSGIRVVIPLYASGLSNVNSYGIRIFNTNTSISATNICGYTLAGDNGLPRVMYGEQYDATGKGKAIIATFDVTIENRLELSKVDGLRLNDYGVNTYTGTAAYILGVTATGEVIETAAGSGASDIDGLSDGKSDGITTLFLGNNSGNSNIGANNTGVGVDALLSNTNGFQNAAFGYKALRLNITGDRNTAIGYNSLSSVTGNRNTALGESSGTSILSGSDNTILGYNQDTSSATASNELNLHGVVKGSNAVGLEYVELIGGRIDEVVTINTAIYTVVESDYDISVTYTPTGAVTITIPTALYTRGRTFYISDDGDNALTNNITIQDDAGTPNVLFTIDSNGESFMIRYNGTEWRLR